MQKKNRTYAQKLIPVIVFAIVLYTIVAIVLQFVKGIEISSTLTSCYFLFWGTEVVSLALIKNGKIKNISEYKKAKRNIEEEMDTEVVEDGQDDQDCEG